MEEKKSRKADLENKRMLFTLIGLVIAVGIIFLTFSIGKEVSGIKIPDQTNNEAISEIIDVVPTRTDKQTPPPKPYISQTLVITDDPTGFDEPEIESSEAYNGMLVDALLPVELKEEAQTPVDTIFIKVEEDPEFPGGEQALLYWVAKHIKYPDESIQNEIQGTVYVNFVVDRDGGISNARVVRQVDPALDTEALRVVNMLPKWKPGKQRGKPVRVSYTIPIRFKLVES